MEEFEPVPAPVEEDVLELTQMVDEPDPFDFTPPPPPPLPPPPPPPRAPRSFVDEDALLSDAAAEAASRAFSGLSSFRRGPSLEGAGPIGRGDLTLEEIVREMIRPMIRDWLDDNLPDLVERLVKREIERVVRRGLD